MTAVELSGVTCTYAGASRPALAGVSFRQEAGAFVVVMGESGAGKTTLARCLTRIVPCFHPAAVEGEIRLFGASLAGRSVGELAGTVGMVFQDFEAQLFSTDVTQEVVFGMEQTGVAPGEMARRLGRALSAVGLAGFAGRDPTTLSGGEKQRLAIAALLAMRPRLMILDEPTTDLDPAGKAEVLELLARLRREGVTVLLIEHEVAAAALADRLVLLRGGEVVADGPPSRLLADVSLLEAAGVRPPDGGRLFAKLGMGAAPLEPRAAAAQIVAAGYRARPLPDDPQVAEGPLLLEVDRVHYRYSGGAEALADVSLGVRAGEFVALLGRNGSGKTTLAKHLNGLLAPTAGNVYWQGRPLRSIPLEEIAQRVGYVFQDPDYQLFAATVEEEVAFGPRSLGLPAGEVRARVSRALAAVGLEERGSDPFVLDKGARQRLAVAAVLALEPEVLILDEPTTGLDFREQRKMMELLRELNRQGRTIIVITHTPWVVAEYARRAIVLAGGRVAFDGPLRELFGSRELLEVADFRAPEVTAIGQCLGVTALSVDELAAALEHSWRSPST